MHIYVYFIKTSSRLDLDSIKSLSRVNLLEIIEDHNMIKDSFNVEIRLPRLEIVTTSQDTNKIEPNQPLFKTTMTHNLTGVQMMTILQNYHLLEWAQFAKSLIS